MKFTNTDFEQWTQDDLDTWDYTQEPVVSVTKFIEQPDTWNKPQDWFPGTIQVDGVEFAQTKCEEDMYGCYYAQYKNSEHPNTLYELICS